jgi:TPP-dependent pyruvate/acetoin dehydrogenase alpha subunit
MIAAGQLTEAECKQMSDDVHAELDEVAKRAEAAPLPKKEVDLSAIFATSEVSHG